MRHEARIVGCGRGSFALTGLEDEAAIGQRVEAVLGLNSTTASTMSQTALEWEVRARAGAVEVAGERDAPARAVADIFPAYDDDEGGVLLVLTPDKVSRGPSCTEGSLQTGRLAADN